MNPIVLKNNENDGTTGNQIVHFDWKEFYSFFFNSIFVVPTVSFHPPRNGFCIMTIDKSIDKGNTYMECRCNDLRTGVE